MFLLLTLALLIVVVMDGSGSAAKRGLAISGQPGAAQRTRILLAGIPQHGSILGYSSAPVTLQFFGDLQCKESRQVMLGALPFLIRRFVRAGKLQIRFRSLETDTTAAGGRPEFLAQQTAALAAGEQGMFWNFVDVFYRDQGPEYTGYVDEAFLDRIARRAGLRLLDWKVARELPEGWIRGLEADEALAKAKRLQSTPSFLIGLTGGRAQPLRHFGLQEAGVFEEAIESLLKT